MTDSDYDAIADDLVARGATRAQMMGRPILKVGSTMFAGHVGGDHLVVERGRDSAEHAEALALPGRGGLVTGRQRAPVLRLGRAARLGRGRVDEVRGDRAAARLDGLAHPLLPGLDRHRQHVLRRRDRAGGELREAARAGSTRG